jgi:hypothetical protein
MSVTTSPPAFADPLSDDGVTPSWPAHESHGSGSSKRAHQGPIKRDAPPQDRTARDRAALLAPAVEGQTGTDAIKIVRAGGLIAAIETVESAEDSQQGVVIEQDPPPGTPMLREGVLTLSVAQALTEPRDTEGDNADGDQTASGTSAYAGDENDTDQWFAALGPTFDDPAADTVVSAPRRRRKHRPAPIPIPGVNSQPAPPHHFSTGPNSGDSPRANAQIDAPPDPLPPPRDPPLEQPSDPPQNPTARHSLPDWQEPPSPQPTTSYTLSDRHGSPRLQPTARYPLANAREAVAPQPTIGHPPPGGHAIPSPQSAAYDPPPQEHWDLSQQPTVRHSLPDWQEPASPQHTVDDPPPDRQGDPSPEPAAPGYFTSLIAAVLVRLPDGSITPAWRRRALICAAGIVGLLLVTLAAGPHSHHAVLASVARAPTSHARVVRLPASRRTPQRIATAPTSRPPAIPPRRAEARRTSHELVVATAAAHPIPTESTPPDQPSEPPPGPFIYLGK